MGEQGKTSKWSRFHVFDKYYKRNLANTDG